MTSNPPTITLGEIEGRAKNYRGARDILGDRVRQLQDKIDQARREAAPVIRSALQTAKAAEAELVAGIAASPGLFRRPKTHVFHGVRVGFEKGKAKVTITDPAKTITLIRKHFEPDESVLLIKTIEKPIKSAIANLAANDLKRIGVEVSDAGEMVIVRPVDSELDKMLDALLKAESVEADVDED